MKRFKCIPINEFELPADSVLVFECSRPDEQPRVGIGPGKFDTGGAAIFFASIEQKGREIGEHVPDCESRDVLAIRFYTPESIDVLIRAAEEAKAKLLREGKEARSCKVGDTVYYPYAGRVIPKKITQYREILRKSEAIDRWYCLEFSNDETFDADDIGKTVFLTRAEAEKALGKEARS